LDSNKVEISHQQLGKGGFGEVFLGYLRNDSSSADKVPIAVKRIDTTKLPINRHKTIVAEVSLMRDLKDGLKIVRCYGVTVTNQFVNIILELAPFGALYDVLNSNEVSMSNVPLSLTMAWICDLADALRYLHDKKVKHKDIKAQNILVFRMFCIKLGDFGFAKEHHTLVNNNQSTHAGTLAFMAPEVLLGVARSSFASDIFSFAMTAVQIMTRRSPLHKSEKEHQIESAIQRLSLPVESKPLAMSLQKCVHHKPSKRPTAEEAYQGCRTVLESCGGDPRVHGNVLYAKICEMDNALSNVNVKNEEVKHEVVYKKRDRTVEADATKVTEHLPAKARRKDSNTGKP
jgi:serine/threonine protein kinase